jgi:sugar O-acyltransferase (sialic acid O-acetyltransferase NeuD family)
MASQTGGRIVIVGVGETAEIAYEYFTHDSPYEVVAFSAEEAFVTDEQVCGLPVVPLERLAETHDPATVRAFVAVSSTHLNRLRRRLFDVVKAAGFSCVSYVSSRAFVWHNVQLGENVFVFEGNVLQHHVRVGDNVVLWSGNHIGHRTVIGDDSFVSSHVVISGFCEIGESSFLGVNSSFVDGAKTGRDVVVGAGAVVTRDLDARGVYVGNPARATGRDSFETFGVPAQ